MTCPVRLLRFFVVEKSQALYKYVNLVRFCFSDMFKFSWLIIKNPPIKRNIMIKMISFILFLVFLFPGCCFCSSPC